jgi:hypothetical protein
MSARAVAVIRPAASIISLPAFLSILSGKRQLHASRYFAFCPQSEQDVTATGKGESGSGRALTSQQAYNFAILRRRID